MEKILPYDRAIVPQETGWYCGPAATQVILNSRNIIVSEDELAKKIGTTFNGTDFVGLIERVLDVRVPEANYTSVDMRADPPTQADKDALWRNIVRSIDGGWGVVMNWVAPPSNYPRGVKGSVSPRYQGDVVYHYVACMGYDDVERAVWIADSGFQPQGYWISFEQCASLIPPKAYCYADVAAVNPPKPTGGLDAQALSEAMGCSLARATEMLPAYVEAMKAAQINTVNRAAAFAAQIGHESVGLVYMAEIETSNPSWNWDRTRYRGRGPIQLTWSSNYRKFGQWCKSQGYIADSELFVNQPELVEQPKWGFLAASWYWLYGGPKPGQINAFADAGDNLAVSRCINGWVDTPNGMPDRTARWNRCRAMGNRLLPSDTGDFLMALTPEQQQRIYYELTNEFRSLFIDANGNQSEFRGTLGRYIQLVDAKTETLRIENDYLKRLVEAIALKLEV